MSPIHLIQLSLASLALAVNAHAVPTDITVRVLARDAKFIGSSMGGARIVLRDAETGEVLAQGVTAGGTGDTDRLMREPRRRGQSVASEGDAAYHVRVDIDRPRHLEVSAYGPLDHPQTANVVTASQWVLPGKHLTGGDGWVLEMPGFVIEPLLPEAPVAMGANGGQVRIGAKVVMMCGCPTEPGGLWDAARYQIGATLSRDGRQAGETTLEYTGETSHFRGVIEVASPGAYDVTVYAYDPENGNTGVARAQVYVAP